MTFRRFNNERRNARAPTGVTSDGLFPRVPSLADASEAGSFQEYFEVIRASEELGLTGSMLHVNVYNQLRPAGVSLNFPDLSPDLFS